MGYKLGHKRETIKQARINQQLKVECAKQLLKSNGYAVFRVW